MNRCLKKQHKISIGRRNKKYPTKGTGQEISTWHIFCEEKNTMGKISPM
jgi:hypothetical protein